MTALKGALSGSLEALMLGLMKSTAQYDASELKASMKVRVTDQQKCLCWSSHSYFGVAPRVANQVPEGGSCHPSGSAPVSILTYDLLFIKTTVSRIYALDFNSNILIDVFFKVFLILYLSWDTVIKINSADLVSGFIKLLYKSRLCCFFQGLGTDEETLIELVCSRNNEELAEIKKLYRERECWRRLNISDFLNKQKLYWFEKEI